MKDTLKVACFLVIIYVTCLSYFDGYITINIGCEEHGQLAEELLKIAM